MSTGTAFNVKSVDEENHNQFNWRLSWSESRTFLLVFLSKAMLSRYPDIRTNNAAYFTVQSSS